MDDGIAVIKREGAPSLPSPASSTEAHGSAPEFNERVERARQRQQHTEAQAERDRQARVADERAHDAELRRRVEEDEARAGTLEANLHAVATALIAKCEQEGLACDALVLNARGTVAASSIPPDIPDDRISGPAMFGIPNLLRGRARKRVFGRHHTAAWSIRMASFDDDRQTLHVTAEGKLVQAVPSQTVGLSIGGETHVQFAAEVDLGAAVRNVPVYESILDGLAGLVARHDLTI
jgi:hypothetical protein